MEVKQASWIQGVIGAWCPWSIGHLSLPYNVQHRLHTHTAADVTVVSIKGLVYHCVSLKLRQKKKRNTITEEEDVCAAKQNRSSSRCDV